jgi:hypothetical protein
VKQEAGRGIWIGGQQEAFSAGGGGRGCRIWPATLRNKFRSTAYQHRRAGQDDAQEWLR